MNGSERAAAADLFPRDWRPDLVVDARGVLCPEPIFRLGRAARDLGSGLVALLADDPAADTDVPAWCAMRSARLLDTCRGPGHHAYLVGVGAGSGTGPAEPSTGS